MNGNGAKLIDWYGNPIKRGGRALSTQIKEIDGKQKIVQVEGIILVVGRAWIVMRDVVVRINGEQFIPPKDPLLKEEEERGAPVNQQTGHILGVWPCSIIMLPD